MILLELRDYLRQRGQASLQDLVRHFASDPASMRAMLTQLIRKGKVHSNSQQLAPHNRCGDCTHCDPTAFEIYYYGEAKTNPNFPCSIHIQTTVHNSTNRTEA